MEFRELTKRLSPTIKRIAYRLKSSCTFFNADDLYQEAQVYLWKGYSAGKLSDKTDSYILQGCYFHMRNYIRMQKTSRKTVSLNEVLSPEFNLKVSDRLESEEDGYAEYLRGLDNRLVADTIQNNGLTEREKQIVRFYADGLTTREIGSRLGISHVRVVKLTGGIREKCLQYLY